LSTSRMSNRSKCPLLVIHENRGKLKARTAKVEDVCAAVYVLVQLIPAGFVSSYGDIAKVLGISPRLVAWCLSRNKNLVVVPCHRIVHSNGELGGYSGPGVEFKRKLLELEGVSLCGNRVSRGSFVSLHRLLCACI
jgi:methylated-DNA-[protein]-cysteine S-methyltransferase